MRFGRLVANEDSGRRSKNGGIIWKCQCDCGNSHFVLGTNLISGSVSSCGCYSREQSSQRQKARARPPKQCLIDGCLNTIEKGAYGLCSLHAQRVRRYGDPLYITPEALQRENQRKAQLVRVKTVSPSTYRKFYGRHEHRVVAEQMLGRPLRTDEHVHHRDGNKHNNTPENLDVMNWLDHLQLHARRR
ncbi:MAG: HNH endonuclease [Magnetococcales bacterium]|nr:HNH endonuclease [Magnetococcales bacterium]